MNKTSKKAVLIFLSVTLFLCSAACAGGGSDNEDGKTPSVIPPEVTDVSELVTYNGAVKMLNDYSELADKVYLDELNDAAESYKGDPSQENTDALYKNAGRVLYEAKKKEIFNFQMISDPHMNQNGSKEMNDYGDTYEFFTKALDYIDYKFADSKALIVPGDITCNGHDAEYEKYLSALSLSKVPYIMTTVGNHEYYVKANDPVLGRKKFIGCVNGYFASKGLETVDNVYYDTYIGGCHFIALGSEGDAPNIAATISDAQINWFKEKLAESDADKPVFVFLHQPLYNTTPRSDIWHAGEKSGELKTVLKNYPNAVLVSGHVHNGYIGADAVYNKEGYTCIDMPAFEYNEMDYIGKHIGYTVSVYGDRVLYTPVDFDLEKLIYEHAVNIK